jgi:AMP nucleosidase
MTTTRLSLNADGTDLRVCVAEACDLLERADENGCYGKITVHRSWSRHNPTIAGQIARPRAYRWYLERELARLLRRGAEIEIAPSRRRLPLDDPELFRRIDESSLDMTRKKLFLFGPERVDLSLQRLGHYTGTPPEAFQRYVLLTNYDMHMAEFESVYPDCVRPAHPGVQMPAYHHCADGNAGVSIVNIGVGPSNAKNLTDHVAVLRPDVTMMIGHCAGVRNHQEIGDFVLASGYLRADRILDEALPLGVPVAPNFLLNRFLAQELDQRRLPYRLGTVYTTLDRNWELSLGGSLRELQASRAVAVDMESATVAANGFRFRIPHATLLCVSDKPLHGAPKLPAKAREFYEHSKRQHIAVALAALEQVRSDFLDGLPNAELRALDEPLIR